MHRRKARSIGQRGNIDLSCMVNLGKQKRGYQQPAWYIVGLREDKETSDFCHKEG